MASRLSRAEHEAALARRLEQLSAELAGARVPAADDGGEDPPPDPVLVPQPGRHASRRAGGPPRLLPEAVRGRVALGPAQLAVVAVLVALGLGVTAWWVVRGDPAPVTPVVPVGGAPPAGLATPSEGPAVAPSGEAAPSATVTVDVAGRVRRPGIAVLVDGARVVDALEAAGGARPGVDLSGLNLARLLVDGEQVLVGVPAAAAPAPTVPGEPAGALVNINTAGPEELETLPEVGPVTAAAIVTWREDNGGFTAVDELLEVDGIGEATLDAMAPFVTV
ncbi:ComEA family DNA-binding protein [Nocardioides euryhalodurans]|uniref:ComEA family DNA-binding protein n=1 Tax=Nocardioides euryhalodurans TaxID=2518370 RepID=A0A4P7GIV5_9ACTN|nr:ComEA family DNA-binding protein [Nocardioides euryhalodurans]QBR91657.1 ComEA family DNA-binding protein [Nocardioides euryhalodurans]